MGLSEIDEGWDFKVLILDDEWVVRWPRHELAVEEIGKEIELLPGLAPLLGGGGAALRVRLA